MLMLATTAAMIEQFNKNNILILEEMGYEVHVAGNWNEGNPISNERLDEFKEWIAAHGGKYFHIPALRKPTAFKSNICAYKKVIELIHENKYEFIHCHTPIGSVIGRLAAHKTHTKIMYTAHGFHFFKGAPILNWLLYYPVEWGLSYWTDVLITINQEDYNRAKKCFRAKRTEYVPGVGVDTERFQPGLCDRTKKRKELGVQDDEIMLLSVGELIPRKNHKVVIEALKGIERQDIKYFICGQGTLMEELKKNIQELRLDKQVYLLGYRRDISELCQATDIFVFPSLQEGLPVALMEAIACHTPVLCTDIRGNTDLVKTDECLFKVNSSEDLKKQLLNAFGERAISDVIKESVIVNYENLKLFDLQKIAEKMRTLYKEEDGGF